MITPTLIPVARGVRPVLPGRTGIQVGEIISSTLIYAALGSGGVLGPDRTGIQLGKMIKPTLISAVLGSGGARAAYV